MRIFQQKGCKTWRVRFSVGMRKYDEALGERGKEKAYAKALELIKERRAEAEGLCPAPQRKAAREPLDKLLERWLEVGLSPEVSRKHRAFSRNRSLRVFAACKWKHLSDVTAASFEEWRAIQRSGEKPLTPKTLNEYLGHLRTFFGWLEQRGMIVSNPLKTLKPLRVVKEDDERAFTMDELQALIRVVPEYRACLYAFAAFTGLRRRELRSLQWNRINLDSCPARIELEPKKTKNRKGGCLPLHSVAKEALEKLKALSPDLSRPVFFKGITLNARLRKDLALAGIAAVDSRGRELELHSFRRTFATMLNSAGVAPRVAMELMRHSDIRLTLGTYNDSVLLPLTDALHQLPFGKSSLFSSLKAGKPCQKPSNIVHWTFTGLVPEPSDNEDIGLHLAGVVQAWEKPEMADREGFEPSVTFPPHTLSKRAH